jgi:hypothetical protein
VAGDHRPGQDSEHGGAHEVDRDDEHTAVDAVGQDAGVQAEQQPGQALEQAGERDQDRIVGLRGDEEGSRRETDPVTEIAGSRGADQPPERRPHARR